jgi:hypothetical protein
VDEVRAASGFRNASDQFPLMTLYSADPAVHVGNGSKKSPPYAAAHAVGVTGLITACLLGESGLAIFGRGDLQTEAGCCDLLGIYCLSHPRGEEY